MTQDAAPGRMGFGARLVWPLGWIGRQGTRAVAASLFLGMALPPISSLVKPILPYTVFLLLALAIVRIEPQALRPVARRPWRILLMVAWTMLAVPMLMAAAVGASGLVRAEPSLSLALALGAAAPPLMSVPAFCFLLGLNGALSLVLMVLCVMVTPITAPLVGGLFLDEALPVAPVDLALRLFGLLAGAGVLALAMRRVFGARRLAEARHVLDGANVVLLFLFAIAIMDGVAAQTLATPWLVLGLVALSFAVAGSILLLTALVMRRLGLPDALSVGLTAANRNLGLMASSLVGSLPDLAWIYFALAQFPIYLLPQIMRPIVERLGISPPDAPRRALPQPEKP